MQNQRFSIDCINFPHRFNDDADVLVSALTTSYFSDFTTYLEASCDLGRKEMTTLQGRVKYFLGFVLHERKEKTLNSTAKAIHKVIFRKDVEVIS
jgi:hypothetical protein